MTLENGNLLADRYRIERVLGQGGMGAVYLAIDENLGTHVAVKENLNISPESERQFKREAMLLATLRHHHLPRVTNHFVLAGQQYLVMDYVEGEDLRERLERLGPLPEADVTRWGAQICDALAYLHSRTPPIIHRDIKPSNIKLNSQGEAILVDFGIAKAASGDSKTTTAAAFTPGYAPPEQYGMGKVRTDPRTDQYALAATLYRLLTNETPPDSLERLIGNATLTPPHQLRPDLSPHVAQALMRGMSLRLEDRFETITHFRAALLGEAPPATTTANPTVALAGPASDATRRAKLTDNTTPGAVMPTVVASTRQIEALAAGAPTTGNRAKPATAPVPAAEVTRAPRPAWLTPAAIGAVIIFVIGAVALGSVMAGGLMGGQATATSAVAAATLATIVPATTAAPPATIAPTSTPLPPTATTAPTETPAPPTPTEALPTASPTSSISAVAAGGRIAFISNRDGQFFQIYTMNSDGSDVQQLTTDPRNKWSPEWTLGRLGPLPGPLLTWSPDGTQLLYTAESVPGGPIDLWVINADGTNPVNLTAPDRAGRPNENDFHPAWCSDGTIAFASIRNNYPQIFIITLENRVPRNYSTTRSNVVEYNPLFFPDCRRMLVISTQNGGGELWRIFPSRAAQALMWAVFPAFPGPNNENSYRSFLSELPQGNVILDADLSPDGTRFVYTRESPGSIGRNIVATTVETSQLMMRFRQLTEGRSDSQPRWSPDGNYLVFTSRRAGGNPQIFRMTADGEEEVNLSNNSFTELGAAWQP
ncbi:MAG: protein kinase [Anaerolineales bacterium]|nr:protein kinase [Anaerolineales bacterium]